MAHMKIKFGKSTFHLKENYKRNNLLLLLCYSFWRRNNALNANYLATIDKSFTVSNSSKLSNRPVLNFIILKNLISIS